jgi:hypothetical protein
MRTGRPILFSVILALGASGAILASPAIATASTHAPAVQAHTTHLVVGPNVYFHT